MCIHKLTLRQPLVKQPDEAPRIERSPSPGRVSGGSRRVPGEKTAGPKKDYNIWDIIWEIIRINWDIIIIIIWDIHWITAGYHCAQWLENGDPKRDVCCFIHSGYLT